MTSEGASPRVRGLLVYPFKIRTYLKVGLTRLQGWKHLTQDAKNGGGKVGRSRLAKSNTTLDFILFGISLLAFWLGGIVKISIWNCGWWFHIFFYVHSYLGKIPILTNIFERGWNHQL